MYKNENGFAVIKLILIIVIIIAAIWAAIYFGKGILDNDNIESAKTDMMQVEGKMIPIAAEHERDENQPLVGIKINRNGDKYEAESGEYILTDELQEILKKHDRKEIKNIVVNEAGEEVEETTYEGEEALYYIWTQKDMDDNGLAHIQVNETEFYIIDYKSRRVFYSVGYDGIFELNDLREKEI